MKTVLRLLLVLSGLGLALGFAGRIHGLGDSLAVLRPLFVITVGILSLIALIVRTRVLGISGAVLTMVATWSLLPPSSPSAVTENAAQYAAYQKNLLFRLPDTLPVAEDIVASGADFVMLQELHTRNRPILKHLRESYPHQHFCPFVAVGGVAVLSQWPALKTICEHGFAAMQVSTPSGDLWVVSLHLHWPFPFRQPEHLDMLMPILETFEGPVLVGGDFNMVPWSHVIGKVSAVTETKIAGYVGGTLSLSFHDQLGRNRAAWMPRLPIDHILIPSEATAISWKRQERFGSDHHGVLVKFAF